MSDHALEVPINRVVPSPPPETGAYVLVRRYLGIGLRYRKLFLVVSLLVLVLGTAMVMTLKRSFMATATVVVTTHMVDPLSQSSDSNTALEDDELATQAELMTSRDVAARVLRQYPPPPSPQHGQGWRRFLCEHGVHSVCPVASEAASNSAGELDRQIDALLGSVTAEPQPHSRIITLSVKADTGERAAALTNALVTNYQAVALAQQRSNLQKEADWLDERTAALRERWLDAERTTSGYNVQHGLTNTEGGSPLVERQIADMATSLGQAQSRYASAQAKAMALKAAMQAGDASAMISLAEQPLLVAAASNLMQAETQRAEKLGSLGPNHPDVRSLNQQISQARTTLNIETRRALTSMSGEVVAARADVDALTAQLNRLRGQSAGQSGAQAEYRTLEQESQSARSVYEAFLDRAKQLTDRVALLQPPVTFVSHAAVPAAPTFPNRKKLMMGVIVLAMVAGVSAIVMKVALSPSFVDMDELRNFDGLPLLAVLPHFGQLGKGVINPVMAQPFSQVAETVRGISAQLALLPGDRRYGETGVVSLVSAAPGDGKMTLAALLGGSLDACGQKTLIINVDPRRHDVREKNVRGFSDVLARRAMARDVIERDPALGVDVMGAGEARVSAFDAAEVLQIRDLLRDLSQEYRMILLVTPPLALALDGLVMASVSDQTVFVCRWGRTSRTIMAACLERLRVYGARMAGIVVTGAEVKSANLLGGVPLTRSETHLLTKQ
ncbi:polysaccharide biosynthesis tyrosine autokinase [Acetobacter estunensis]|uniref:GumC family protein n=1 Tax=Acetobacter estunensis TaxID=104097 RepID=UPI0020C33553|nr:polysaccharide biosynthesis tyrosine autokinase [Acetobacter estunensis]